MIGQERLIGIALATISLVISLMTPAAAADAPKQEVFASGQPAMSIGTAFYSSLQQSAGLAERYAGVKVKVQPTPGSTPSMQAVSSGNAFYAWSGVLAFLEIAARDPSLVMVSFDPGNPYRMAVLAGSSIKSVADLKGKKIGVQSFGSGAYGMGIAIVAAAGLDPKRDVIFVPVGVGAIAADALRTSKVDAFSGNDATLPVIGTLLGQDMRILDSPVNRLPGMNGIVVTRKEVAEQPKVVAGLCKAFYAAPMFAKGNMGAAVLNHWAVFPKQRPAGDPAAVLADGVKQLKARLDNLALPGEDGLFGFQSIATMKSVLETLKNLGVVETLPDLAQFVDLRFAKEVWHLRRRGPDAGSRALDPTYRGPLSEGIPVEI